MYFYLLIIWAFVTALLVSYVVGNEYDRRHPNTKVTRISNDFIEMLIKVNYSKKELNALLKEIKECVLMEDEIKEKRGKK